MRRRLVSGLGYLLGVVSIMTADQFSMHGLWGSAVAVLWVVLGLWLIETAVLRDHHRRAYPKRWECDRCPSGSKFMVESNNPDVVTTMTAQHLHWHNEEGR